MKSYGVTIQMKPLQQYFHMVPFIFYVVLTFESVDEILWCDHSNESFHPPPPPYFLMVLFSRCLVCSVNFWDCRRNPMVWPFQWNFFSYVVLLHGTIYLVCSPNVWDCGRNPMVWPSKWNLERQYLHEVLFAFLTFCKIKVCFLFIILTLASSLSEQVKKPCQFCIVS